MTTPEFKAKCLALICDVEQQGGELVLSKNGFPVARLAVGKDKPR